MSKRQYQKPHIRTRELQSHPLLDQISGTKHDAVVTPDPTGDEGGARETTFSVWGDEAEE